MTFAIRASGDPQELIGPLRRTMASLDPDLPLYQVRTMEERMEESLTIRRAPMVLAGVFAGVALFLAAIGIYGVLAYLVTQRRKELGIRIALGGGARAIFALVLGEGLRLVGVGFIVGIAGTVVLTRMIRSQLYGVGSFDPLVLVAVMIALGAAALVACAVPAGCATRIDPVLALNRDQ